MGTTYMKLGRFGSVEPEHSCYNRNCPGDEFHRMQSQIDKDGHLLSGEVSVVKHLRWSTSCMNTDVSEAAMLQSNATRSSRVAVGLSRKTVDVLQKLGFAFKHKFFLSVLWTSALRGWQAS